MWRSLTWLGLLIEAAEPRAYWAQLKGKLGTEGASETLQALNWLCWTGVIPAVVRSLDSDIIPAFLHTLHQISSS
jgi:hypothetical protein